MSYEAKFVVALLFVLTPVVIVYGSRVVALNVCSKKAQELNINSTKWKVLAFIIPVISMIVICNYETLKKWGIVIQVAIAIEVIFVGVATFKIIETYRNESKYDKVSGAPNWRMYQGRSLEDVRAERRNAEIKSTMTTLLIETCVLGLVVFLIERTRNETEK